MKKIRVAIIGYGRSGRDIHAAYLKTDSGREKFEIDAVAETDEAQGRLAASELGCEYLRDYTELYGREDIDLVVNAAPSHLHVPISVNLMEHGKNVICEKPLTDNLAEYRRIIACMEKNRVYFNVFQQARFAPYFVKIKEVLASGVLGGIVDIHIRYSGFGRRWDWQTLQIFRGGNLLNTGPHPLDQALDLLAAGDTVPSVICKKALVNTYGDAEDFVKIILSLPDKPLATIEISSCDAYTDNIYRIQTERGGIIASGASVKWRYFIPSDEPPLELTRKPLRDEGGRPQYCSERLTWHEAEWSTSLGVQMERQYYDMTYDALVLGIPPAITPYQLRTQAAVIEECRRQNPLIQRFD